MVTAVFTDNDDYARTYGLWQWDYGQQLRIEGLHLPTAVEIHFALQETGGEAITRVGTTKDGVTTVTIPDSMLEGNRATWTADKAYNIYAWVYLSDKSSGETIKRITMQVKSRPKPEAFEAPGDGEIFHEAIEAVNDAAKRAEEAGDKAIAAADEAEKAATQTAEHLQAVQGLAEQVETNADTVAQDKQTVTGMLSQTQQAASDAALSAQEAKLSETAAAQAQTGAEAAEDGARQYAEETGADRQAVANDKQTVTQMREAVAADRQAVEQTAAQFGQTSQDALTAIGQAQSTAVGAVKAEGNKQTTAVQEAGTQAVSEVTEAKTTAVEAVTAEGDKQTKRVEDAAAGIVADREQISQNKTDIAGLAEGMTDLAPAIRSTVSGSVITADDAAEGRPFRGLRVFGKSTQDGTPTPEAPVPIVSAGESGNITVEVGGKNLLTGRLYFTNYSDDIPFVYKEDEVTLPYTPPRETLGIGYVVPCKPGVQYTFSVTNPNKNWRLAIAEYENFEQAKSFLNKIGHQYVTEKSSIKYTAVGNGVLVCAIAGKWTDGKTTTHECTESELLQLEYGDVATPYEPYRPHQTLNLQTPNGLPGVPVSKDGNYTDSNGQQWICDEIDLGRGKYVQRIEEHILKSKNITSITNSRQINSEYYGIEYNGCTKDFVGKFGNGVLCDKLAFVKPNSNINGHEITYVPGNGIIVFGLKKSLVPSGDLDEIRNYITSNNFAFLILIDSPIEKDLTPEEITEYKKTHTNYPTTVITNDAGAHMEVAYVADTKNYIHNLEERLNAKLVNIQSALISQKISGGCGGGIKVTDSSRVPVVRFAMWGKTEQVRTSGKNLFDISSLKKYEVDNNDLKASVDNEKIVLEGKGVTTTEVIFFCLNKTDDLLKLNPGKYTLSFKSNMPMGTAHKSKTVEAFAIIKKADGSSDYSSTGNKGWTTFDIAEGDMMYFRFDINNGTMTAEFYDIQLEYGDTPTEYEPYTGGQPSPSPNYPQPIEVTDQPITVTVKGGTESQSITLTPPRPFTKWDRLEKVDGVWCWVYQSAYTPSYSTENIATEYYSTTGELSAGAEVYYKTDAPENIPLTPSEQAQLNALTMYAGTTEITNNGGCTMDLTYTADTKTYIDNKLAAISAAMIGGT